MNSLYMIMITGVILVFVFFMQSKWTICVRYQFPDKQEMQISVFFYKWCIWRKKNMHIAPIKHTEMEKGYMHFYNQIRRGKHHFLKQFRISPLLKALSVDEFKWRTQGGTGDALTTSIFSGSIWAMKGWLVGYLDQHLAFQSRPQIHVQPDFQKSHVATRFSCMISFRLGKTMLGIIRALKTRR